MTPITWVVMTVIPLVALAGIFQIPLVVDAVTATGYASAEVFSGIAGIWFFFSVIIAVFEVRMN